MGYTSSDAAEPKEVEQKEKSTKKELAASDDEDDIVIDSDSFDA